MRMPLLAVGLKDSQRDFPRVPNCRPTSDPLGLEPVFPRTQEPPGLACFSDPATILAVSLQRIEFFALSHAVRWISEACRTVWCRRRISPSQACRHARPGMRIGECPLPCQATRKRRKSIMISHFCKSLGAKQKCGSFLGLFACRKRWLHKDGNRFPCDRLVGTRMLQKGLNSTDCATVSSRAAEPNATECNWTQSSAYLAQQICVATEWHSDVGPLLIIMT